MKIRCEEQIYEEPHIMIVCFIVCRVQTCASVFSMLLRDRQPQLAQHLVHFCSLASFHGDTVDASSLSQEFLSIHPLMYMTSWFMCLFSTLPCWDTVLAICDIVFLEGTYT